MSDLLTEVRRSRSLPAPPLARAIREAAGVTRKRLAEELDVHMITVARWERGSRQPRGDLRTAYAALLQQLAQEISG